MERGAERVSTNRTKLLLQRLRERAMEDRSGEWFERGMLPDIGADYPNEPVIVRRARAIAAMLGAMTDPECSKTTRSFEIGEDELIVGVLPMGSLGLGKVFPNYLTEEEKRVASVVSRSEMGLFGHNTVNYERLLKEGIRGLLAEVERCENALCAPAGNDPRAGHIFRKKSNFYRAVRISLEAVASYAEKYTGLARTMAGELPPGRRKAELQQIAQVCERVPQEGARTFHEALQSIYFMHLALHASMNFLSLGRLDQVLHPYLEGDAAAGRMTRQEGLELFECFLIKCSGRLNLNPEYFVKQDHSDFGSALGTSPVFLDKWSDVNNWLTNIVISGKRPDGSDARNACSDLILEAYARLNISSPTLNVRLHGGSPPDFVERVAAVLAENRSGLPTVYNDDAVVPALLAAGLPEGEAYDYAVDGCWEPVLNGRCDWTFRMLSMLNCLECALNGGAMLTGNPMALDGLASSVQTPGTEELTSYAELKEALRAQIGFACDQTVLSLYKLYSIDESIVPTPLYSALLEGCLETGFDKTWGGAKFTLGGVVIGAVPDVVNTLLAIDKWVFGNPGLGGERRYTLPEVAAAFRFGFQAPGAPIDLALHKRLTRMKADFQMNSPKFGSDDPAVVGEVRWLLDTFHQACIGSDKLAQEVFLEKPAAQDAERVLRLRFLAGYPGPSLQETFGEEFRIHVTLGSGTFEGYTELGMGNAASADRENPGDPVAPNFTPIPGTMNGGLGHLFASLGGLELNRFASGVVVDACLDGRGFDPKELAGVIQGAVTAFLRNGGNILTLTVADAGMLEHVFNVCEAVRAGDAQACGELRRHADVNVRVGGFQAPFVTLPRAAQANYVNRPVPE
jgi:formate C-acetyltransferase